MKIFYPFRFHPAEINGRMVHIRQFIRCVEQLGDRVVTLRGDASRGDPGYPKSRAARVRLLRGVDVVYERLEGSAPSGGWYRTPQRLFLRRPVIAWEFNTVPEMAGVVGASDEAIARERAAFRRLAGYCDVAFCVSDELARYVRSELGIAHALTVPNGSDPELFRPDVEPVYRLRCLGDRLNVVWIGSADLDWHDFDLLKQVAGELWRRPEGAKIAFHVVGRGLASTADLPPNVSYHGAVAYDELPHWLAGCQVGLVAYRPGPASYSSPLKLFDYLASGLAVVSTEQPQVRQLLAEIGCEEQVVPSGDVAGVVRNLLRLADEPARRQAIGRAGRVLLESRYSWRHNAVTIRTELERLVRARRGAPAPSKKG